MTKLFKQDTKRRSEAGKSVPEETDCPICGETVTNTWLPKHIREEHSDESEFPPEP